QEREIGDRRDLFDHAIVDAKDDVERAEGDVRNAEKTEGRVRPDLRDVLRDGERQSRKTKSDMSRRSPFYAQQHRRQNPLVNSIAEDDPNLRQLQAGADSERRVELQDEKCERDEERPSSVRTAKQTEQQCRDEGVKQQPEIGEVRVGIHAEGERSAPGECEW